MTIALSAIYRYPIKGFTGQELDKIQLKANAPMPWDRAFAIENGPSGFEPTNPAHISKNAFLVLMKHPELAQLKTSFDPASGTISFEKDGEIVAKGNLLIEQGHKDIEAYLAQFCHRPLNGSPKIRHSPGHAFTDSKTQDLSLINLESVKELGAKIGAELDPMRFRGNFYIENAPAWAEHDWVGQTIKIGGTAFKVRKRTIRCAATNANPATGERDQQIPKALMQHYGHADCGIHLVAQEAGLVKKGDLLSVTDQD
ncbi:MAG: MOSC domain-containing protein [Cohaesibacter sp.]|nr:MOSC domain-containing protein [Cohaesibacter sp.]